MEGKGGGRRESRRCALDIEAEDERERTAGDNDDGVVVDVVDDDDAGGGADAAAAAQRSACDVAHAAHDTIYLHDNNHFKHKTRYNVRGGARTCALEGRRGHE